MSQQRPETLCPRCGSSDLTYKNVFDYFKCNSCKHTFITPKYVYDSGETQAAEESEPASDLRPVNGLEYSKAVARELFGEDRITREPQKIEPEVMPPIIEPQVIQPQTVAPPAREPRLDERIKRRMSGLGWLILFISILVVVLLGLLAWFFYPEEIKDLLGI